MKWLRVCVGAPLAWWPTQPRHDELGECHSADWGFFARHRNLTRWCLHGELSSTLSATNSWIRTLTWTFDHSFIVPCELQRNNLWHGINANSWPFLSCRCVLDKWKQEYFIEKFCSFLCDYSFFETIDNYFCDTWEFCWSLLDSVSKYCVCKFTLNQAASCSLGLVCSAQLLGSLNCSQMKVSHPVYSTSSTKKFLISGEHYLFPVQQNETD